MSDIDSQNTEFNMCFVNLWSSKVLEKYHHAVFQLVYIYIYIYERFYKIFLETSDKIFNAQFIPKKQIPWD